MRCYFKQSLWYWAGETVSGSNFSFPHHYICECHIFGLIEFVHWILSGVKLFLWTKFPCKRKQHSAFLWLPLDKVIHWMLKPWLRPRCWIERLDCLYTFNQAANFCGWNMKPALRKCQNLQLFRRTVDPTHIKTPLQEHYGWHHTGCIFTDGKIIITASVCPRIPANIGNMSDEVLSTLPPYSSRLFLCALSNDTPFCVEL